MAKTDTKKATKAAPKPQMVKLKVKNLPKYIGTGNMIAYTSSFQISQEGEPKETFRLTPVTTDCKFIECFWNPFNNSFVIVTDDEKQVFKTLPKLSSGGSFLPNKNAKAGQNPYQQERLLIKEYNEHYLTEIDEVNQFLTQFVSNQDFDWLKYLEVEVEVKKK